MVLLSLVSSLDREQVADWDELNAMFKFVESTKEQLYLINATKDVDVRLFTSTVFVTDGRQSPTRKQSSNMNFHARRRFTRGSSSFQWRPFRCDVQILVNLFVPFTVILSSVMIKQNLPEEEAESWGWELESSCSRTSTFRLSKREVRHFRLRLWECLKSSDRRRENYLCREWGDDKINLFVFLSARNVNVCSLAWDRERFPLWRWDSLDDCYWNIDSIARMFRWATLLDEWEDIWAIRILWRSCSASADREEETSSNEKGSRKMSSKRVFFSSLIFKRQSSGVLYRISIDQCFANRTRRRNHPSFLRI